MAELRTIDTTKILHYKGGEGNTLSLYIATTSFKNEEEFYLRITKPIAKDIEEGIVYIYNGDVPASEEEGVYKVYATETTPFGILDVKENTTYKCTFLDIPLPGSGHRTVMELSEKSQGLEPPTSEPVPIYKCCYCCRKRCYCHCCCKPQVSKPTRPPFNPN